jgi:hypothetical protein
MLLSLGGISSFPFERVCVCIMIGRKLSRAAKKLGSACVPLSAPSLSLYIQRAALGVMIKLLQHRRLTMGRLVDLVLWPPRDVNFQLEQWYQNCLWESSYSTLCARQWRPLFLFGGHQRWSCWISCKSFPPPTKQLWSKRIQRHGGQRIGKARNQTLVCSEYLNC